MSVSTRLLTAGTLIPLVFLLLSTPCSPLVLLLLNLLTLSEYYECDPYNVKFTYSRVRALCVLGSVLPLFIALVLTTMTSSTSTSIILPISPLITLYYITSLPTTPITTTTLTIIPHLISVTLSAQGYTCMHCLLTQPTPVHAINLCLLTWGIDTLGLIGGKAFSQSPSKASLNASLSKLWPFTTFKKASPTKTPTGYIAMLLFAHPLAALAHLLCSLPEPSLAFSLAFTVAAILGDLYQSVQKRKAGVKDSGKAIKGHGGVWDRMDSMLFTAVVYLASLT